MREESLILRYLPSKSEINHRSFFFFFHSFDRSIRTIRTFEYLSNLFIKQSGFRKKLAKIYTFRLYFYFISQRRDDRFLVEENEKK